MKIPFALAVLAFSAVALVARADTYDFKAPVTRSGPFSATGKIVLENVNGSVDVHTWDKNEISIEAEESAKTEEELKLIDLKIDLAESAAKIVVKLPKRSGGLFSGNTIRAAVHFKLTVPATAVLEKIAVVNSNVTLENLRGAVRAETVNGSVKATNLGGDARLETVNGSVKADFAAIAAGQKISAKTVNGRVTVRIPKDAGLQLRAETVNGGIDCDLPITLAGKRHRHSLSGKIGDGRASLEAETVNGSVHLETL